MQKSKRVWSILLVIVLMVSCVFTITPAAGAGTYTIDQAMAWCESQVGKSLDYYKDQWYAQCVELICYYYEQFGFKAVGGNGSDYSWNALPSGWTRIAGATPQKGDIMVWVDGLEGCGHVAICGGPGVYYHQNFGGSYVRKLSNSYTGGFSVSGYWANYWGVIRPKFSGSSGGNSSSISYTSVTPDTYYIKNSSSGTYLAVQNGADVNTQNVIVSKYANSNAYKIKISAASTGYKFRPLCSSSRLINPYADTVVSGKNVNLYNDVNDSSQWWRFQTVSGGGYVIRNVQNPSCVLALDGSNVIVSTYTGASNQIWTLHKAYYTIKYNANGGSNAPANQTKTFGYTLTLSSQKPTRTGYTFLGWSTSSSATTATYQPGGSYKSNLYTTFYAVWSRKTYSAVLNNDGGSGGVGTYYWKYNNYKTVNGIKQYYYTDSACTKAFSNGYFMTSLPKKSGYTFAGYYTKKNGEGTCYVNAAGECINSLYKNAGNITLYACWKAEKSITSVKIQTNPSKTVYIEGESLKLTGMKLQVKYSNNTSKTITSGWTVSGYNKNKVGMQTITVSYGSKKVSFVVTVKKKLPFKDVAVNAWYYDQVAYCYEKKLMSGTTTTTFAPETTMTRAMVVQVLYTLSGKPLINGKSSFRDVKSGQWYTDAVAWAEKCGITSGVGDGSRFDPNGKITRSQMARMLQSYAGMMGVNTKTKASLSKFSDATQTPSWAKSSVQWAVAEGLISGVKQGNKLKLMPNGNASRAQVATILKSFVENIDTTAVKYSKFCGTYASSTNVNGPCYVVELLAVNDTTKKATIQISYIGKNGSPLYTTGKITTTLNENGTAAFTWSDNWGNSGTGKVSVINGIQAMIGIEMKVTKKAATNRATLATDGIKNFYRIDN